jgi:hypothetical protein
MEAAPTFRTAFMVKKYTTINIADIFNILAYVLCIIYMFREDLDEPWKYLEQLLEELGILTFWICRKSSIFYSENSGVWPSGLRRQLQEVVFLLVYIVGVSSNLTALNSFLFFLSTVTNPHLNKSSFNWYIMNGEGIDIERPGQNFCNL